MTAPPTKTEGEEPAAVLQLVLESTREAPSIARAALAGFCQDRKLGSTALALLMLLVSEIVTNAVLHPAVGSTENIGFAVRAHTGFIRVEVTDQGNGFTPKPRDPAQLGGGYGLYLLDKEANHWGVNHQDGTTVWFEVGT